MMDEIIERYKAASRLHNEVWERRVRAYNDDVAVAILDSWKDILVLLGKLGEGV